MKRVPFGWAVFFCVGFFFMGFTNPIFFVIALIDFVAILPTLSSIIRSRKKQSSISESQKIIKSWNDELRADYEECAKALINMYSQNDKEKYEALVYLWDVFKDDERPYLASKFSDVMGEPWNPNKMRILLKKTVLNFSYNVSDEYAKPVDQLLMEINKKVGGIK